METLYLLIPVSVILVFFVGLAFWWSLRSGQFDDLDGPAYRVLMDDDRGKEQGAGPSTESADAAPAAAPPAPPDTAAAPLERRR
ncbi:cbb3-type cytochrome oxidase assembly protein CcoS [Rhodocyclus tenuis]|uniref:Cbb3-type cytochrome oxidase maturation protein n=1 Tax=Rhodocyclus tenuis TaxID=1066 RepID=A0A840FY33_RHOTE|nr:cbb3-type cytochrome oxidase assembly protein CcoS [Rhodocyclus tenuis]MBB4246734.1 cbb3-type cytochrome oxidase maturation protein [Rhodocyclus tenuis]